jgi:hypothetical protein
MSHKSRASDFHMRSTLLLPLSSSLQSSNPNVRKEQRTSPPPVSPSAVVSTDRICPHDKNHGDHPRKQTPFTDKCTQVPWRLNFDLQARVISGTEKVKSLLKFVVARRAADIAPGGRRNIGIARETTKPAKPARARICFTDSYFWARVESLEGH